MYADFAQLLKKAVRFEIAPGVGAMAHAIKDANASRTAAAMQFCRLPFPLVWFEWIGPAAALGVHAAKDDADASRPVPDRMGVLIQAKDEALSAGIVAYAWSHKQTGAWVCPLATTFDWSAAPGSVPTVIPDFQSASEFVDGMRRFRQYSKDRPDDLLALRGRHGVVPNPWTSSFFAGVIKRDPSVARRLVEAAWQDIQGEQRFVEAILAVLNCRNLVDKTDEEDLAKLNKARKRAGKPALLQYRRVIVSLSRVTERKSKAGAQNTVRGVPLHIVRGHPKVRKTGIYWWSPFLRGDEQYGRVERAGYEIRP
jgi:hypothetical protein